MFKHKTNAVDDDDIEENDMNRLRLQYQKRHFVILPNQMKKEMIRMTWMTQLVRNLRPKE